MGSHKKNGSRFDTYRFFLKDTIRQQIDFRQTEQNRFVPAPPLQKPCPAEAARTALPDGKAALRTVGPHKHSRCNCTP